jgi:N-acetylneuraminic acid mutarotase
MKTIWSKYLIITAFIVTSCNENESSKWEKLSPFPGDKLYFTSVVNSNKCYIFFGEKVDNNINIQDYSNTVWVYDAIINQWEERNAFNGTSRSKAAGFSLNSHIYIVGGETLIENPDPFGIDEIIPLNDVLKYDIQLDTWETLTPFPGVARSGALSFSVNNNGY